MHRNGLSDSSPPLNISSTPPQQLPPPSQAVPPTKTPLVWDWALEHEDRNNERKADQALRDTTPFEVDRKILKDVVREKMGVDVGRIKFLSAGTFHKAYLITLVDHHEVVARVARRFMPRLKTESEVATLHFLRHRTKVPVPTVYHYDSNPYNRLGGEFILMSKAPGIPLAQVYHGMAYNDLVKLLKNLAAIIIPLFAHRFPQIGSLYFGRDPSDIPESLAASGAPTPKANQYGHYAAFPFSPTLAMSSSSSASSPKGASPRSLSSSSISVPTLKTINNNATPVAVPVLAVPGIQQQQQEYHVGPIISWPFFGSNRGELAHPHELNRGPWPSTSSYLSSCVSREIQGVILESEGKSAPHKLHLDPDEIHSSRHHRLKAVPGDQSDDSDEWGLEESEDEWEGPGDMMYRDYRRNQRSTFLLKHMKMREELVRKEMGRWRSLMGKLVDQLQKPTGATMANGTGTVNGSGVAGEQEEFGLDCHDLSLENVFVDEHDNTKITCIIDWESTTTRPLWACAHIPAFLQSSPFVAKLFREVVAQLPNDPELVASIRLPTPPPPRSSPSTSVSATVTSLSHSSPSSSASLANLCAEWLYFESAGIRLRMAHRCAEWDGWEEGLVDSILGTEDLEDEWLAWRQGHGKYVGAQEAQKMRERDEDERDEEQVAGAKLRAVGSPMRSQVNRIALASPVPPGRAGGGGVGGSGGFVRLGVAKDGEGDEEEAGVNGYQRGMVVGVASQARVGVGAHRSPYGGPAASRGRGVPGPPTGGAAAVPAMPHLAHLTRWLNKSKPQPQQMANGVNGRTYPPQPTSGSVRGGGRVVNGFATPKSQAGSSKPLLHATTTGTTTSLINGVNGTTTTLSTSTTSSSIRPPSTLASISAKALLTNGIIPASAAIKLPTKIPLHMEKEKEQMLNTTGDMCGGRGGELGRRLEAWLHVEGPNGMMEKRRRGWIEDGGGDGEEEEMEMGGGGVKVDEMHSR